MPYRKEEEIPSEPHPLDAVIWRALTSVQESLAEGDERARRYPADIAPFAAMVDTEPASFRSLLTLVGGDDQIAVITTEEVEPPSAFSVVRRAPVDQMVLEDAGACTAQPGPPIAALGVADVPEMLALANVTQPGPFLPRTLELRPLHRNSSARRAGRHGGRTHASRRVHRDQRGVRGTGVSRTSFRSRSRQIAGFIDSRRGPKSPFLHVFSSTTMRRSPSTASWALPFDGGCISRCSYKT